MLGKENWPEIIQWRYVLTRIMREAHIGRTVLFVFRLCFIPDSGVVGNGFQFVYISIPRLFVYRCYWQYVKHTTPSFVSVQVGSPHFAYIGKLLEVPTSGLRSSPG